MVVFSKKVLLVSIFLPVTFLSAQVDTIDISRDLLVKQLPEGTNRYAVFVGRDDGTMRYVGLWNRAVRNSRLNGKDCIVIDQEWWTGDSAGYRKVYSIVAQKDFSPLYHYTRDGKGKVEAYNFAPERVAGADTVVGNSKAGFSVPLTTPTLNWELDLEVFQILPYSSGKTFVLNFYHPGGPPPGFHSYTVSGEETLALAGGGTAPCWILSVDYGRGGASFWVSKNTREILKSKDTFPGGYRYKIKLATDAR